MKKHLVEKNAICNYLISILTDFHKSRLEGKGYDFYFVLSNDLEQLQKFIKKFTEK